MRNWKTPGTDALNRTSRFEEVPETDLNLWQCCVIYKRKIGFLKKTVVPFMFTSPKVNDSREAALAYASFYIKQLIEQGDLPPEVINDDNTVNDDLIKTAVISLSLVNMEKDVSDR